MIRQTSMRFSGEEYTFTSEDVSRISRDVPPERITQYFVELHGRRYPPKQLIRLVTGTRKKFNSANARSALTRLGFVVKSQ